MILLTAGSLTPVRLVDVETQSLVLKERQSTASFTTTDMTGITINSWFQDETDPGAGIVWRVKSIQQAYATKTPTVQLEHVINVLRNRIMFGEVKASTITGDDEATTCTARQAIEYILDQQSDWELGTFDYGSVSNPYKFDGDNLYDALEMVTRTLEDAWWSYDFSTYPFKLNITEKQSGIACELREGRNINAISKTIDRAGMYTRFFPIGKDDLHITGNYVSRNEATYGIICKVEVDSSLDTEAELTAWANERLSKHAEPVVTITVDGLDLAQATGESLDAMQLGRICRIPLQEFGSTIEERIIELNYRDKKHNPEVVRITLGNQRDDLTHLLAEEIKNGGGPNGAGRGGGGRGGARQAREDHAWFEDTDEHVAMVAESIIGVDADGNPNWTRLSSFIVDGQGIHGDVHTLVDGTLTNQATLDMTESRVSIVVDADGNVIPASIVAGINGQSGSYVKISADTIDLTGYVTVSDLNAVNAKIDNLTAGTSTATFLKAQNLYSTVSFYYDGHMTTAYPLTIGGIQYYLIGYRE